MSPFSIRYFDGHRSVPHEAAMEIAGDKIWIYDTEHSTANAIVFPVAGCKVSKAGGNIFVFPENAGGSYLQVKEDHPDIPFLLEVIAGQRKGFYHQLMQQRWPVLLGCLAGIFILIYFAFTLLLPSVALRFISKEREVVLGEAIFRSVISANKIDAVATNELQEFVNKLRLSNRYNLQVTVVHSKEVNAFALPGGHIVVYSGILKITGSPESLAALLAHEATHINERHSLHGLLSGAGWALLQSVVFSGFGDLGNVLLSNAGSLQQLSYSRKLEREADAKGMELLLQNKLDPGGMKKLMMEIQQTDKSLLPALSFMSTHPLTGERINNADDFIRQHKNANFVTDSSLVKIWKQLQEDR